MSGLRLIVIFGLIASGKTTLARSLSQSTGWLAIHSDVVRKILMGLPPSQRVEVPYGQGIYAPDVSGRTYREMFRQARAELQAGRSVILEGSFMRAVDRLQALELAAASGAQVFFILCSCPTEETLRRLVRRAANRETVSDGRQEILMAQKERFEPITDLQEVPVLILDTGRPVEAVLEETLSFLNPEIQE